LDAAREAREEAGAEITIEGLLAVYSIARISQVQLIYSATLANPAFAAGPESLEVQLFPYAEIRGRTSWPAFSNPPGATGNY
jgi:ADP-ribose pyrophosphatase YjhB (NUDIX family)